MNILYNGECYTNTRKSIHHILRSVKPVNNVAHLRNRADGMNLSDERAVGLEEEEKLEVQLVKPLTQLQLLEDMKTASNVTAAGSTGPYMSPEEGANMQHAHIAGKVCRFCAE